MSRSLKMDTEYVKKIKIKKSISEQNETRVEENSVNGHPPLQIQFLTVTKTTLCADEVKAVN